MNLFHITWSSQTMLRDVMLCDNTRELHDLVWCTLLHDNENYIDYCGPYYFFNNISSHVHGPNDFHK